MSDAQVVSTFFAQVAVILLVCRAVGYLAARVGQPQVMAEMVAGFLMGPSLFGWLAPGLQAQVFPAASRHALFVVSQIGRRALHVLRRPGVPFRADDPACAAGRGGLDRRHRRAACSRWRTGRPSDAERRILRTEGSDVSTRCCSSAPRCRSPRFRCSRGSSTSGASPGRRWARSRSPQARWTMRPHG